MANTLIEKDCGNYTTKTVGQLFTEQIEALIAAKRTGYALSVRQAYTSLMRFNGHLNTYFFRDRGYMAALGMVGR